MASFIFIALGIRPQSYSFLWLVHFILLFLCEDSSSAILFEDSSSPVWIRPLSCCVVFSTVSEHIHLL